MFNDIIESKKIRDELNKSIYLDNKILYSEYISKFNQQDFPDRPGRKVIRKRTYEEIKELLKFLK